MSENMRRSILVLIVAAGLAGVARADEPLVPRRVVLERVVAVVNEHIILESELADRILPDLADLDEAERKKNWKTIARERLEQMIDEELAEQAAAEAKLEVTDDEVVKAIEEVKRNNKLDDER